MNCIDIAIDLIDKAEKPLRIAKWTGESVSKEQEQEVKIITGILCEFIESVKRENITHPITPNKVNPLRKVHTTTVLITIEDVLPTGELIFSRNIREKTYDITILLRIRECLLDDNNTVTSEDIAKEFNVNSGTISKLVTAVKQGDYTHIYKKWDKLQQNPLKYDENGQLVF